jgi:hypothetical protein
VTGVDGSYELRVSAMAHTIGNRVRSATARSSWRIQVATTIIAMFCLGVRDHEQISRCTHEMTTRIVTDSEIGAVQP